MRQNILTLSLLLLPLASGCNYRVNKVVEDNAGINDTLNKKQYIVYADVKSLFFDTKCVFCHGSAGGVSVETYQDTIATLDLIQQAVLVDKSMPPGDSATDKELLLLQTWIQQGALESAPTN